MPRRTNISNASNKLNNKVIRTQRPASINPWATESETNKSGSVWIKMKPRKILDQYSKGAGTISTEELNEEFIFLAPLSLNENVVHHWEAYESVASRIAQKVRSGVKLGAELASLGSIFKNAGDITDTFKNIFETQGGTVGSSIEKFVKQTYGAVGSSRIPRIKVDTPLYYTNSDRRQLVLEFQLFHENINSTSPEEVLIEPIQKLMKYSSPDLLGGINIDFPYIWEVSTLPYEFIKYTTCALVAVQPTWNSPYLSVGKGKNSKSVGFPSSVNLQLTFQDMSPLYRDTIERGSIVRVINREQSRARNARNQFAFIQNKERMTRISSDE